MCAGKNIKKDFSIFLFQLKNLKLLILVPIIIILCILPSILYFTYRYYQDIWYVNEQFIVWTQILVPVLSVWSILFSFVDLIESEGNELYYMNHKMKDNLIWFWFVLYMILVAILCVSVSKWIDNIFLEYIRLCISSLFYTMLAYLIMYATHSMTATFLSVICYWLMSSFGNSIPVAALNCYNTNAVTLSMIKNKYVYILIISILMYLIAYRLNKKMEKYS